MYRLRKFAHLVWQDIGMEPFELVALLTAGAVVGVLVGSFVWLVARLLCWVMGRPLTPEVFPALFGLMIFCLLIAKVVLYVICKWKETKKGEDLR